MLFSESNTSNRGATVLGQENMSRNRKKNATNLDMLSNLALSPVGESSTSFGRFLVPPPIPLQSHLAALKQVTYDCLVYHVNITGSIPVVSPTSTPRLV